MERVKKEMSILGRINDLSHKLVLMLVFPIIISLVLMLFYAWKYHSSIVRMETITNLKTVVAEVQRGGGSPQHLLSRYRFPQKPARAFRCFLRT